MKHFIKISYVLILFYSSLSAQVTVIDSLSQALRSSKADSTHARILNELCWELKFSDPQKALEYAEKALNISKKINDHELCANSLRYLGVIYYFSGEMDTAVYFYNTSMDYYKKNNDLNGVSKCLNNIGLVFESEGKYKDALNYYNKSLDIDKQAGYMIGVAASYLNIGVIYQNIGEYQVAIEHYIKAIKIYEKENNIAQIAGAYVNIGAIYEIQKKFIIANEYNNKAHALFLTKRDNQGIASCLHNIGYNYLSMGKYDEALTYLEKSLKIRREMNLQPGIASCLQHIGTVYENSDRPDKALEYYFKAIELQKKLEDEPSLSASYYFIGNVYTQKKNYDKALEFYNKSMEISTRIDSKVDIKDNYEGLAYLYAEKKNFEKAYYYEKRFFELNDSIFNTESNDKIMQLQTLYETEKKEKEIQLLNKEAQIKSLELTKKESEVRKQRILIYSFVAGFLIILTFSFLLFREYKQKKAANLRLREKNAEIEQQKEEISAQRDSLEVLNTELYQQKEEITTQRDEIEQKSEILKNAFDIIEEKNKNITDSIKYARRIQEAIFPPDEFYRSLLPGCFVLFKPKDIVSGDFYWFEKKNDIIYVAAVDCTGHGVPGAFMSIVGYNLLNQALKEHHLVQPAAILDYLNLGVNNTLRQTYEESAVKDGMDIVLCAFSYTGMTLEYAGAMNNLLRVRNNELTEFKTNRISIGVFIGEEIRHFTNYKMEILENDIFYIYSDGYEDQFGGPEGRKFKAVNFKKLLLSVSSQSMAEQKANINKTFDDWKAFYDSDGRPYEQVDDMCVIGIKV